MGNIDCENGVLHIGGYSVPLKGLLEILDIIHGMVDTEIVDVSVEGKDVICTFADGEVQTAHCHPEDEDHWTLDTGISVCLGKYLAGGSNAYNRLIHQGMKIYERKRENEIKGILDMLEEERIRENKRRKHERYLKRREERRASEEKPQSKEENEAVGWLFELADLLRAIGVSVEIEKI